MTNLATRAALLGAAALLLIAGPAAAQTGTASPDALQPGAAGRTDSGVPTTVDTATFLRMATSSNQFEILSSRLAVDQAANEDVKAFANWMIDEHTSAGSRLAEVTKAAGISQPTPLVEEPLSDRHKEMLDTLARAESNFEPAYVRAQYQAHVEAVRLFSAYVETGDNAELQAVAAELLPHLQQHLEAVKTLPGSPAVAEPATGATIPGAGAQPAVPGTVDGMGSSGGMQGGGTATGGGPGGTAAQ